MIKSVIKNKIVIYLSSRYITYFIQFLTSILIAAKLGPYYMGIWGAIMLILNYFGQFHFGIANSLNVILVHNSGNKKKCDKVIINSFILVLILSLIVLLIYFFYKIYGFNYVEKYHIDEYSFVIILIAILQYFSMLITNIFRIKNMLNNVAVSQSIIIVINFVCTLIFPSNCLIISLVYGNLIGNICILMQAFIAKIIPHFSFSLVCISYQIGILKKGLYLFIYNSCFYFIIISIRTIISSFYSIREFGLFTFSFTIANAFMLLVDAFSFIIFPKIIKELSTNNNNKLIANINNYNNIYTFTTQLIIYLALVIFPLFIYFVPKYKDSLFSMNLIALTVLINSISFAFGSFLIAKNEEKQLSLISFISLIVNCIVALVIAKGVSANYSYVILATMISYFVFNVLITQASLRLILGKSGIWEAMKLIFNKKFILPYLISLVLTLLNYECLIFLPLVVFLILNYKQLNLLKKVILKVLNNPNITNI